MAIAQRVIEGSNLSDAWIQACRELTRHPGNNAAHLIVRIGDPSDEGTSRPSIDQKLRELGWQSTQTVANTIFPSGLAIKYPKPADLAAHYRDDLLPRLKRLSPSKNGHGTYFERLVAYPRSSGATIDQLTRTVEKLLIERATPTPLSSRYEIAFQTGDDLLEPEDVGQDEAPFIQCDVASLTYSPAQGDESRRMGFPCLSLASFHLDGDRLHLTAHYRNQHLLERGYGNYLGLGRLLSYVAAASELVPGELLVVAGHALLERTRAIEHILGQQLLLPSN